MVWIWHSECHVRLWPTLQTIIIALLCSAILAACRAPERFTPCACGGRWVGTRHSQCQGPSSQGPARNECSGSPRSRTNKQIKLSACSPLHLVPLNRGFIHLRRNFNSKHLENWPKSFPFKEGFLSKNLDWIIVLACLRVLLKGIDSLPKKAMPFLSPSPLLTGENRTILSWAV